MFSAGFVSRSRDAASIVVVPGRDAGLPSCADAAQSRSERLSDPLRRPGRGARAGRARDERAAQRGDALARRPGALLTLLGRMLDARDGGRGRHVHRLRRDLPRARARAEGGRLTCFEVSAEYAEIARRNVERAGLSDRVTIEVGPAQDALERIPEVPQIDLAYVDADKTGYPGYYDALVPRLRPGGVLVLDNMLLGERVLDPADERAAIMDELNERIAADERVESVLLGLSDGVTLARRRT